MEYNNFVLLARVDAENMKMVKINSFNELHMMPKTKWGIIEPLQSDGREDCLQTGKGLKLYYIIKKYRPSQMTPSPNPTMSD